MCFLLFLLLSRVSFFLRRGTFNRVLTAVDSVVAAASFSVLASQARSLAEEVLFFAGLEVSSYRCFLCVWRRKGLVQ